MQAITGLRLRAFRGWLHRLEPDMICGLPCNSVHCVLARYLRLTTGQRVVVYENHYVLFEKWSQRSPYQVRRLQPWARAFRHQVDTVGTEPVVAGQAQVFLARALEESKRRADRTPERREMLERNADDNVYDHQ